MDPLFKWMMCGPQEIESKWLLKEFSRILTVINYWFINDVKLVNGQNNIQFEIMQIKLRNRAISSNFPISEHCVTAAAELGENCEESGWRRWVWNVWTPEGQ